MPAPDVPELRGRHLGSRRRPTTCSPARAAAGGGSDGRPVRPAAPATRKARTRPGARTARSSRSACDRRAAGRSPSQEPPTTRRADAALDVAARDSHRRDRGGARPDLGRVPNLSRPRRGRARPPHRRADVGDEPRRRRPPARRSASAAPRPSTSSRAAIRPGRSSSCRPTRTARRGSTARIQAHCVMPREDAPETCAEHDLPDGRRRDRAPPCGARRAAAGPRPAGDRLVAGRAAARDAARATKCSRWRDRLVVDGSTWSGDGLARLIQLAASLRALSTRLSIRDFALVRQSRWREAIASVFDMPEFLPYLTSIRRIAVTYATHDERSGGRTSSSRCTTSRGSPPGSR